MEFNPFLCPFPMGNARTWTVEDLVSPLGKPNQPQQKEIDCTLQLDSWNSGASDQEETVIPRVPGHCDMCLVDETPLWRGGPNGSKTLCNACGLRYSKELKKVKLVLGEKDKPSTGDGPSKTPKTKKPKKVKSGTKKKQH